MGPSWSRGCAGLGRAAVFRAYGTLQSWCPVNAWGRTYKYWSVAMGCIKRGKAPFWRLLIGYEAATVYSR